jgi:hypothetical protein
MIRPNRVSEIRSTGSSTRLKGMPETSDMESIVRCKNYCSLQLGEQTLKRRGAVEPSDLVFDRVGSQQISR